MRIKNPFKNLTKFELFLWLLSIVVTLLSFILSGGSMLSCSASIIGVTSLIFIARGEMFGQYLIMIFSLLYGILSIYFRYYGEMITYLFMTTPIAVCSIISWAKNPYKDTGEVAISSVTKKHFFILLILTFAVTFIFYFILKYLGTASLLFSTLSIATSFFAASLTYLRSPYYALGYMLNDLVLIILWIIASLEDISCLPMIFCFVMFLINDLYGFYSWQKRKKIQAS